MPRPRYRIIAADVRVVHRWIRERLRNDAWPENWPRFTAWDKFPYEKPTVKTLQRWCDRFLDTKQWKQLHAVIRASRRDLSRYRTVRLSRNAHEILGKLAMRDKLTLSEVIDAISPVLLTHRRKSTSSLSSRQEIIRWRRSPRRNAAGVDKGSPSGLPALDLTKLFCKTGQHG